jgi:cystathionine beta-lyase family protein involved in aluminum resistance
MSNDDFMTMLGIAKEDLMNPMYEAVVREYEEANMHLDHARCKLIQAVKLTDYDKFKQRCKSTRDAESAAAVMKAMQVEMMHQRAMMERGK